LLLTPAFADQPPVPRTADGHPDLSGVWQGGSLSFAVGIENAKKAGQSAEEGEPSYVQGQDNSPPYQPGPLPNAKSIWIGAVSTIPSDAACFRAFRASPPCRCRFKFRKRLAS
jgi:hypothetical protein